MSAHIFRNLLIATALVVTAACAGPAPAPSPASLPAPDPLAGVADDVRSLLQPDNGARRDALLALLARDGFAPRIHDFRNDGRDGGDPRPTGRNVVVSVGSGEPAIVAGAHFDAAYLREGTLADGMVDNAASVVVLLRVAAALRDVDLGRRVDFVFFDMEEIGLVGSRHYAEGIAPGTVAAMVNLDVNAYGDTVFFGQTGHGHAPLYRALAGVCSAQGRACIDFERYPPSDHLSFERARIPNVSLSVLPRAEVHQLWLLMNAGPDGGLADGFVPGVFRTIHSPGDTIERVEPAALALAYDVATALLTELAR